MNINLVNEIKYVTKGVVIFNVLVITILFVTTLFNKATLLGLIFGSIIGMLNFVLLARSIDKSIEMPASKAQIYSSLRYSLRMAIVAVVLYVAAKAPHLNIITTAMGLLSIKFVILTKQIIYKLKRKEV